MRSTTTMHLSRAFASLFCVATLCAGTSLVVTACDTETATYAAVENGFAELPDGGNLATRIIVYKTWWETTLFTEPVLPTATSGELRTVPERDTAYALLAPGWDPESGGPPTTLIPVRSKELLAVGRGEVLRILVSDATFSGNCAANQALSQEDADFITQRIFPGEFAELTYDAKTCTAASVKEGKDGGVDAAEAETGVDAGPDAADAGPG